MGNVRAEWLFWKNKNWEKLEAWFRTARVQPKSSILEALNEASGKVLFKVRANNGSYVQMSPPFEADECLHEFGLRLVETRVERPEVAALIETKRNWLTGSASLDELQSQRSQVSSLVDLNEVELAAICASSPDPLNAARLTARLLGEDDLQRNAADVLLDELIERYCARMPSTPPDLPLRSPLAHL